MACRLVNLHTQPLRIDLRGGEVLVLPPQARSSALREELLYDNPHLADWERAGWLRREPARLSEVGAAPAVAAAPGKAKPAAVPRAAKATTPKPRVAPATGKRAPAKRGAAKTASHH